MNGHMETTRTRHFEQGADASTQEGRVGAARCAHRKGARPSTWRCTSPCTARNTLRTTLLWRSSTTCGISSALQHTVYVRSLQAVSAPPPHGQEYGMLPLPGRFSRNHGSSSLLALPIPMTTSAGQCTLTMEVLSHLHGVSRHTESAERCALTPPPRGECASRSELQDGGRAGQRGGPVQSASRPCL